MKKFIILLFLVLVTSSNSYAYQNPYQKDWFDAVWNNDCVYDFETKSCKSESINLKNYKYYNIYHPTNGYYCIAGSLYKAVGNFALYKVQPSDINGASTYCTKEEAYYFKTKEECMKYINPKYKPLNKIIKDKIKDKQEERFCKKHEFDEICVNRRIKFYYKYR